MADVHFSWSDSIQAAFSCLPCFQSSQDPPSDSETQTPRPRDGVFAHAIPPPRARPDELEGLLADASDDADALSLHTNPGDRARRKGKNKKRRRGAPKHIRVFGYDLFGRPPAIQLPESDDEGLLDRRRGPEGIGRTVSGSSMDSDAAPLDAAAIESLSAARQAEAVAREEEERQAKEERRRRRRERKELKRAAMARALDLQASGEQDDFEGFQGSGPLSHALPSTFAPSLTSGTGSGSITSSQDFGPFAQGQPVEPFDPDAAEAARHAADADADGADFGGESYTSRPRKSKSTGGSGTMTTSDTRSSSSRGTGSNSNGYAYTSGTGTGSGPAPYNHQFMAHQPYSPSPLSPSSDSVPPSPLSAAGEKEPKKRRKSKSKPNALSVSHSTSSQSATASSLLSPPPSTTVFAPAIAAADDFEGFPGAFSSSELASGVHAEEDAAAAEQRKRSEYLPVTGFPSVGFRGPERRGSDMGVFLARRGDE
ncbi:hypothetical protein C8Q80DRAFT_1272005 [Daedaleopsis nitida]|nr:hypothetical protein C8Q80DRAFT_1272005 [Daedaleopsis nitida]